MWYSHLVFIYFLKTFLCQNVDESAYWFYLSDFSPNQRACGSLHYWWHWWPAPCIKVWLTCRQVGGFHTCSILGCVPHAWFSEICAWLHALSFKITLLMKYLPSLSCFCGFGEYSHVLEQNIFLTIVKLGYKPSSYICIWLKN